MYKAGGYKNDKSDKTDKTDKDYLINSPKKKKVIETFGVNTKSIYSPEEFMKDCPNYKEIPTILPKRERIIAIGDIHGDYNLAVKSFKLAKLIDDKFNWIAKPPNTVVVQVGDQIDSCRPIPGTYDCHNEQKPGDSADDVKIMEFFNSMDLKARAKGGAVYSLLGNHELMNSQGRLDYVSHDNYYEFNYTDSDGKDYVGREGRIDAFKPGGPIAKMMACTRISVLIIGSNMFVHAGVLPKLVDRLQYLNLDDRTKLRYLNSIIRKWLLKQVVPKHDRDLFLNNPILSPFWTRIFGTIPEGLDIDSDECFQTVKKTLEVFRVGKIIVGHTPQLFTNSDGINGTCYLKNNDKTLYRVDGGFANAFKIFENDPHDVVQVLEILHDDKFIILRDSGLPSPDLIIAHPEIVEKIIEPEQSVLSLTETEIENVGKIFSQNRVSTETLGVPKDVKHPIGSSDTLGVPEDVFTRSTGSSDTLGVPKDVKHPTDSSDTLGVPKDVKHPIGSSSMSENEGKKTAKKKKLRSVRLKRLYF